MEIQLSESLTKITLLDLKWAVNQRYVEPDPIWVGLNVVSLLSSYSAAQINRLGYKELTGKNYPSRIKNNWNGNWTDLVDLVTRITEKPLSQVNYQLKRFTHVDDDEAVSIRFRNFVGYEVFAQSANLQVDYDGVFWLYDYNPLTYKLRAIPMQLLKEQFIEYESRCL
jgi:hypothetical protein